MRIDLKRVTQIIALAVTLTGIFSAASMADDLPKILPLANAGFEDNLTHWAVRPEFEGQITVVDNPVHSGKKSIRIDPAEKLNKPFATQMVDGLIGGAVYQFSAWARVAPGSSAVMASIGLEVSGENGPTGGWYSRNMLPADGTWMKFTVKQMVSGDTNRASLLVRAFGDGAVIFDDATLEQVGHAPDLTVIGPKQSLAAPGEDFTCTYKLALRQPWNKTELPQLTATLSSLDNSSELKNIPVVVAHGGTNMQIEAAITVPKLKSGSYAVQFQSQGNNTSLQTVFPTYIFTTLTERKPTALTDDGTLLWNGKPFFPIGVYQARHIDLLAENGFNAIVGSATSDLDAFKSSLDTAQKYGLAVDVPLYLNMQVKKNLPNSLEKVRRFANHPAILSWKIFDEPHIRPNGGVAIDIPSAYRALKAADPNHPIELTLNSTETQQFWSNFCDIVQPDSYPLPRFPMTLVSDVAKSAKSFMRPWQNMSFVLQCGWEPDLANQPSVAQARSMVYLALINGAKGIWWYSMHENNGWDLTKTPLWPHMKDINAEIKVLSEPLMLGKVVDGISCDQPKVLFRAVEYQNKTYLLITNPEKEPVQVTFTLPENLRLWHPMNSDVSSEVRNHKITLPLQSIDSHTLVLEK